MTKVAALDGTCGHAPYIRLYLTKPVASKCISLGHVLSSKILCVNDYQYTLMLIARHVSMNLSAVVCIVCTLLNINPIHSASHIIKRRSPDSLFYSLSAGLAVCVILP